MIIRDCRSVLHPMHDSLSMKSNKIDQSKYTWIFLIFDIAIFKSCTHFALTGVINTFTHAYRCSILGISIKGFINQSRSNSLPPGVFVAYRSNKLKFRSLRHTIYNPKQWKSFFLILRMHWKADISIKYLEST